MDEGQATRLTDRELYALFDRLFPHGFAGADVVAEIAPEGWDHSPLLACFHPSVEQLFEERVAIHRNLEELRHLGRRREAVAALEPRPEPTLDDVRRKHEPSAVNQDEEVTELVGLCLWDIFSDNHEIIAADGRVADIGSFRGAGAFLDEYLTRDQEGWRRSNYMRFYMGTIWISRRADLTPVYAMIFRRLKSVGADWVYHFPELRLVEFAAGGRRGEAECKVFGLAGGSHRGRDAEAPCRGRAVPGGAARVECACTRTSDGPATTRDRARVSAGVRARSPRLATRVNGLSREPIVHRMMDVILLLNGARSAASQRWSGRTAVPGLSPV